MLTGSMAYLKTKQICEITIKRGDLKKKGGKIRKYFAAISLG